MGRTSLSLLYNLSLLTRWTNGLSATHHRSAVMTTVTAAWLVLPLWYKVVYGGG